MPDTIRMLNDLVASCNDSDEAFGEASKGVHSDILRNRLSGIARLRTEMADELGARVRELGGKPPRRAHASWRQSEESIHPKDDRSLLDECIRADEDTLRHYEHVLTRNLPAAIRPVIEGQRLAIQEALMELRSIEAVRRAG